MKDGYVNEGQTPFVLPESVLNNNKRVRDEARRANKKHYGLTGLITHTHTPCCVCGRKSCSTRDNCKEKKDKRIEGRSYMVMREHEHRS